MNNPFYHPEGRPVKPLARVNITKIKLLCAVKSTIICVMASVRACGHKILILPFLHLQIIDAHMAYVVTAALAQQHNVKVPQTNRAVVLVF